MFCRLQTPKCFKHVYIFIYVRANLCSLARLANHKPRCSSKCLGVAGRGPEGVLYSYLWPFWLKICLDHNCFALPPRPLGTIFVCGAFGGSRHEDGLPGSAHLISPNIWKNSARVAGVVDAQLCSVARLAAHRLQHNRVLAAYVSD